MTSSDEARIDRLERAWSTVDTDMPWLISLAREADSLREVIQVVEALATEWWQLYERLKLRGDDYGRAVYESALRIRAALSAERSSSPVGGTQ